MPALPSIPNLIKAGFNFGQPAGEAAGRVALHILYTGGPPDVAAALGIANGIQTAVGNHLAGLTANELTWDNTEVTDLSSPTGAVAFSNNGTHAGTRGTSDLIAGTCVVTLWDLARRYRGGHPKNYWPFGVSGDLGTFNTWDTSFTNAVDTALDAFITEILGVSSGGVALTDVAMPSYFHGFTPFTEPSGRVRNIPTLRTTPLVDVLTYKAAQGYHGFLRRRRGKV